MKIGLLIYGSLQTISGGNIYDKYLVDYLESKGDQVEIVSLPWRNYPAHLANNLSSKLTTRLTNLEVDLLIEDELCHPSLFLINRWIKSKVSYPIISLVHHLRSSENHPAWLLWFYKLVEKRYLNSIDGFIFNSTTTQNSVQTIVPKIPPKVIAYPGGNRLEKSINEEQIRQRALRNRPLQVVFLGSITSRKQPHLLVEACSLLPPGAIEVTLIGSQIIEARYARNVRKMTAGLPVKMLETLNADELSTLLANQDILVVPSTYEGFGIVYLEGMGFGLPAIATTNGAAHETICHDKNGFLIQPGDAEALANHLHELANDRQKLLKMSLVASQTHQQGPTWDEMGQKVYEFLHNVM